MADMTQKEHVKTKGEKCPRCGSTEIEGDAIDIIGEFAVQPVGCMECDAEWMNEYTLSGYGELK